MHWPALLDVAISKILYHLTEYSFAIIHFVCTQIFRKTTCAYQGVCYFFGKCCVRTKWMITLRTDSESYSDPVKYLEGVFKSGWNPLTLLKRDPCTKLSLCTDAKFFKITIWLNKKLILRYIFKCLKQPFIHNFFYILLNTWMKGSNRKESLKKSGPDFALPSSIKKLIDIQKC